MLEWIHPLLIPMAFFYSFAALIGIIGNAIMIIVFFKFKNLRSPCHYLITLTCFADMCHVSGQIVFVTHLFSNSTSSQSNCFYMIFIPCMGLCLGSPLIMVMGIDRMICCQFPIFYRNVSSHPIIYTCLLLIFPFGCAFILMYIAYLEKDPNPENQVVYVIPVAMRNRSFEYFNYSGGIINVIIVILYGYTYFKLTSYSDTGGPKMRSVFKSILVTVIFVLFGWAITFIVNSISYKITSDPFISYIMQIYAGVSVNIALVCNVFVFYFINTDYRVCIKKLLHCSNAGDFESSDKMTIWNRNQEMVATK
ncbi:unnamed protein product [Caenorhabditis bovis]|uniref:G-protein coupled receptors family 1 profile domain-containing protein n=1 Tax=Caenorhabditis bovis TaxID=2654633 RepID=A0A8S1EDQ5_9PELO|nr:unnamed protein product [Caenorhabditis bovis]